MFSNLDNSMDNKLEKLEAKFTGIFEDLKEEVNVLRNNIEKKMSLTEWPSMKRWESIRLQLNLLAQ